MPKTLYDKIFDNHIVKDLGDGLYLLAIDRHLMHEVTSPQAFTSMKASGRKPFDKKSLLLTEDHNIPTKGGYANITDIHSKEQVDIFRNNADVYELNFFPMGHPNQGVVHVVAPEQGFILPGMTMICGDSHTATHGAMGSIAFGIGTSEVSHALQTGTLQVKKLRSMRIIIDGKPKGYISPKDVILRIIGYIGSSGGTGFAIEFTGSYIENISMEGRMTICNMAIEAGAKVGLIATDNTTLEYLYGKPMAPTGDIWSGFEDYALKELHSDHDAVFDNQININISDLEPQVTWGTTPDEVSDISGTISLRGKNAIHANGALKYMDLQEGQKLSDIYISQVFIGSCTNGRIEDFRAAADVINLTGMKKHKNVKRVLVVPGSGLVKKQAEMEGIHNIFINAGFEWRDPGCSSCLGMNDDTMPADEHVASTSNRNFMDRQGNGARTHLCSPLIATLAALHGKFVHPNDVLCEELV